jgi:hypothetical protein
MANFGQDGKCNVVTTLHPTPVGRDAPCVAAVARADQRRVRGVYGRCCHVVRCDSAGALRGLFRNLRRGRVFARRAHEQNWRCRTRATGAVGVPRECSARRRRHTTTVSALPRHGAWGVSRLRSGRPRNPDRGVERANNTTHGPDAASVASDTTASDQASGAAAGLELSARSSHFSRAPSLEPALGLALTRPKRPKSP